MPRFAAASLIAIAVAASPALAQPGSSPGAAVPVQAPPPVPTPPALSPPPVTTAPPPVTTTPPETTAPETAPANQPVQQSAPPPPAQVELPANVAYPNGLADPEFANISGADNDRGSGGFPWGLLGLLGLLGLVPWVRGGPKTIYVERERPRPQDPTRPPE